MIFEDEKCAEHLAGMVRFATVSHEKTEEMDLDVFYAFHAYLEQTYPLVHESLERQRIGKAALLYYWRGKNPDKGLPLLLTAHQDVVPAGDESKWKFPPFSGVIDQGYLYGRGSSDDKIIILGHMEAIEALLKEGFQPETDVYLAYGYTEEVAGGDDDGIKSISEMLKAQGIRLGCVIDEGMGVGPGDMEGVHAQIANLWTAEKGYANFEITVNGPGGHAGFPAAESVIAVIGQVAADIQNTLFPYRLTNVTKREYQMKAAYMDLKIGEKLKDMEHHFESAIPILDQNPVLASRFRTTMALTMLQSIGQANVLPTTATLMVNCRLLPGDRLFEVEEKLKEIVKERGQVRMLNGREASTESATDTFAYRCIERVMKHVYPEAVLVPGMLVGGTDSRHFYPICDSVYRFSAFPTTPESNAHNINERVAVKGLHLGPLFIWELIQEYQKKDEKC